jgi:putative membrane protein
MHYFNRLAALGIGALALALPSMAQSAAMGDSMFVTKAAQGGMAEVKMGQLAIQKSKNATVLAFAHRMVTDHTKNNAQLAAIAKGEGRMLPSSVGPTNEAMMTKLQGMSGAAFDHAYLAGQVAGHQQMLVLMQNEAAGGSDPKLMTFAKMTAPVVQQHLGMAKQDLSMSSGSMGSHM